MVKKKKVKIFSNFALDYIENDAFYFQAIVHGDSNSYDPRSINYGDPHSRNYDKIPRFRKIYLSDSQHYNSDFINEFRMNPDDNIFTQSGFSGVLKRTNTRKTMSYRSNYGFNMYIFTGMTRDAELNKALLKEIGNPFVPLMPRLECLKTIEDKVSYIKKTGDAHLEKSFSIADTPIDLLKIIDIIDKNGNSLSPKDKTEIFPLLDRYNPKKYDELQKTILWLILFNELSTVEDNNKTLGEFLKDENFVSSIKSQFTNFKLYLNDYTPMIVKVFCYYNYPSNISYAKTLKARDKFLSFTKNDLDTLKSINAHYDSNTKTGIFEKINIKVSTSTPNIDEIAVQWISALRGENNERITTENYKNIVAYSEMRAKSDIFNHVNSESSEKAVNEDYLKNYVIKVNPASLTEEFNNIKRNNFIRLLNLLGENYIRNEIKLSHLTVLIKIIITPSLFIKNSNADWIEKFIIASLGKEESSSEEKTSLLNLIYEIYHDFDNVSVSLKVLKKDSTMFDMYKEGLPLYAIFNTMQISHENNDKETDTPVRELTRKGF